LVSQVIAAASAECSWDSSIQLGKRAGFDDVGHHHRGTGQCP